jgi:hypothetical protein
MNILAMFSVTRKDTQTVPDTIVEPTNSITVKGERLVSIPNIWESSSSSFVSFAIRHLRPHSELSKPNLTRQMPQQNQLSQLLQLALSRRLIGKNALATRPTNQPVMPKKQKLCSFIPTPTTMGFGQRVGDLCPRNYVVGQRQPSVVMVSSLYPISSKVFPGRSRGSTQ